MDGVSFEQFSICSYAKRLCIRKDELTCSTNKCILHAKEMSMADSVEILSAIKELRDSIRRKLLSNPEFKALLALEKVIAEIEGTPTSGAAHMTSSSNPPASRQLTQPEAAAKLLEQYGPLTTAEILGRIGSFGVTVSGNDPAVNLSSSLSKSGQFRSIRLNGMSHWWFKERELPTQSANGPISDPKTDVFG